MKKIDQAILDRAVQLHYKNLKLANTITKIAGVIGMGTFATLSFLATPGDPIIQAYAVGIFFSTLLLVFSLVAGEPLPVLKKIRNTDNVNKF